MTDHIITYGERIGSNTYLPADRLDVDNAMRHGLLNEGLLKSLKTLDRVSELTPETFRTAISRRVTGSPWPPAGFTQAELEERGLIEKGFSLAPPEEKRAKAAAEVPKVIDTVELTDDKIAVGPYFLQPRKNGHFTYWSAADSDGRLLRAKGFRNVADGTAFLEGLSTESPPAATPEAETTAEQADGSDLQPSAPGSEGPDSPEDR